MEAKRGFHLHRDLLFQLLINGAQNRLSKIINTLMNIEIIKIIVWENKNSGEKQEILHLCLPLKLFQ